MMNRINWIWLLLLLVVGCFLDGKISRPPLAGAVVTGNNISTLDLIDANNLNNVIALNYDSNTGTFYAPEVPYDKFHLVARVQWDSAAVLNDLEVGVEKVSLSLKPLNRVPLAEGKASTFYNTATPTEDGQAYLYYLSDDKVLVTLSDSISKEKEVYEVHVEKDTLVYVKKEKVVPIVLEDVVVNEEKTNVSWVKDIHAPLYKNDYVFQEPEFSGNTFYVDPVNGSVNGDGSSSNPWKTLQSVIDSGMIEFYKHAETNNAESELITDYPDAPVKGGDKLILRSGYHGHIRLNNFMFKDWLHIVAAEGETPVLAQFALLGAFKKIHLNGISVIKGHYVPPAEVVSDSAKQYWTTDKVSGAVLALQENKLWGKASEVVLQNVKVSTVESTSGWTNEDWALKAVTGLSLHAVRDFVVYNSVFENVKNGINVDYSSDSGVVAKNVIRYFKEDGLFFTTSDLIVEGNSVYYPNRGASYLLRCYSRGEDNEAGDGVMERVVIRNNYLSSMLEDSPENSNNPFAIGCFDGFYDDFLVEHNLATTDAYHGIAFYGLRNSNVLNNTVLTNVPGQGQNPWIIVTDHKERGPSENVRIMNNIAMTAMNITGDSTVVAESNFIVDSSLEQQKHIFNAPEKGDYRLLINDSTRAWLINRAKTLPDRPGISTIGAEQYQSVR